MKKEEIIKWLDKNVTYEYYTENKHRKKIRNLFKTKTFNCKEADYEKWRYIWDYKTTSREI